MNSLQKTLAIVLVVALFAGMVIPALAAEATGIITALRAEKNEVVLTQNFKNLTFQVPNSSKIVINGRDAKLAELQAGDEAVIVFEKQGRLLIASVIRCNRK